ncbi:uncharacterized protein SEPMUDRAFT_56551 [Sphaerulina musiva SO2202]|uniref:Ribophorin II C-terminal domain-containing protein n=1 Tax=Sphaerulina musiva (strain SO2202) TaxID=692275 RepID=N1QLV8_SPHMS|nr:uncharacterized protein SEPMUDRAFT_56551 [Sphaerulina musiva SO2202]EMF16813.1 hypothetical protein SEPMUDRAFT_56551 [Sphaerulina musiva SO2202]
MKLLHTLGCIVCAFSTAASAAGSWSFNEATLSVSSKGSEAVKQKFAPNAPIKAPVVVPAGAALKVLLTTQETKSGKRPHQAFLTLHEESTGLEESFAFSVKDTGKAKLDISAKDIPHQFLSSSSPVRATITIASFGSSAPYSSEAFRLTIQPDPSISASSPAPERYTAKPEIHHIFKSEPKSPPTVISLFFTLAILATLPALLGAWLALGGNVSHATKAFSTAPVAHGLFLGSVFGLEGVFFLYYSSWKLGPTLSAAAVLGVVAYISGSQALTEVQQRRLSGQR